MQVTKQLSASMMKDNATIGLQVVESQGKGSNTVNVPISTAEFAVAAEMARFLIPRCLGLDKNS
jgi:hypothetical protein